MTVPLLTTKLYVPPPRPNRVPRPNLIRRLDEGLRSGCKLTLISAPAGFGKTTLLGEWIQPGDGEPPSLRVAWISLDEGDNDPVRFLAYLIAALRTIEEGIGESVPGALGAASPPPVESILTGLINDMAAISPGDQQGRPYILVLDDYHLITAQPIHDALAFLLDHLPARAHLVIATRADPPLPIARLRGRGQVTELRQADLRFTPDEVAQFLNQVFGLELGADEVAALATRTEGWIAGLQMAAVSMQGRDDTASFVQAFTGSNRHILEYLVEEVLQHQSDSVQTFLLQTSILERLSGPLCDAILLGGERPDTKGERHPPCVLHSSSASVLEYLEHANLFLVPLDDHREWYRYHRLFADLLRQRLHQAQPDLVPTLHRRASEWHQQYGQMAAAIDHVLVAEDFERAASLIEGVAEATFMRSELATLRGWVGALPDSLVRTRPSLCAFHAWALLLSGQPLEVVEALLQNVDADAGVISVKTAPVRALVAVIQGQASRAARLSRQALEELSEDDLFLRDLATLVLGNSYLVAGDTEAGRQILEDVGRASQMTGNVMIAVLVMCNLAQLSLRQGQLHKAKEIYQQALDLAVDGQGQRLPVACKPLIGLGELWREWNDLDTAAHYLLEAIELGQRLGQLASFEAYISLARVKQAQGDVDGARDAIKKARQLAIKFDTSELDDLSVAMYQARLSIGRGDLGAAMRWAEERGLDRDTGSTEPEVSDSSPIYNYRLRKYEHLVLARLLIALGRPGEALALLERWLPEMERQGRTGLVIEIQMLKALAFSKDPGGRQAQGDVAQALSALERALSLAESEGYVRIFVDEGPPMAKLLYEAADRNIMPIYAGKLLAAFEGETQAQRPATKLSPASLVEPLSERELEVLRLIADGLSNQEIAHQLVLSLPTIKWHTSNIYGKLGVKNRTQAITKARTLGVLPLT